MKLFKKVLQLYIKSHIGIRLTVFLDYLKTMILYLLSGDDINNLWRLIQAFQY